MERTVLCGVVSMGNPHCVIQVEDIKTAEVESLGSVLEQHERFPERANIGFMQVVDKYIYIYGYLNVVLEKLKLVEASACAAVAVGISQGLLDRKSES